MSSVMDIVESLWELVISIMWNLWLCYAVIVLVYVQSPATTSVRKTSCDTKTEERQLKEEQLMSIQKMLKKARKLIKLRKFLDADKMLCQGIEILDGHCDINHTMVSEIRILAGRLYHSRSVCLYHQGEVINSMAAMDKSLAITQFIDSNLLNYANRFFQLFHKWCDENFSQFQMNIVKYFFENKTRLEIASKDKVANTGLLLESIHCLILSDFLINQGIFDPHESTDVIQLCKKFHFVMKSQKVAVRI